MNFHWAIYGQHKEGHAILAQTGIGKIAERLARFTDRPGDPPAGAYWASATSGFVFEDHFVLLRTIPDNSGRPGMVQSFAVFVPVSSLDAMHSLMSLLALLPSKVIAIPAEIMPLELPQASNVPQVNETLGLAFILECLAANTPTLPLVWGMPNDYLPTIDTLWGRLPCGLREKFAFTFHFEPGNKFPVQPQIVATLPILTSRWPSQQIIPQSACTVDLADGIVGWFLDVGSPESYRHLVSDYGLDLKSFQNMSHLARFSAIVAKGRDLDFTELTLAVRILSAFGVTSTETKHKKRANLFESLAKLIPTASPEDILKLRNLPETSLPEFIPIAQAALSVWISQGESRGTNSTIQILEEAIEDLEGWWSAPFINWLTAIGAQPSVGNARILAACIIHSTKLANHIVVHLPQTPKWETEFLKILPVSGGHQNLAALAEKQNWLRLHAALLADEDNRQQSLSEHSQIAKTSSDGYEIFLQRWGYADFLRTADAIGATGAIRFLAVLLPRHLGDIKQAVFSTMTHGAIYWKDVLALSELDQKVKGFAIDFVNGSDDQTVAEGLLRLSPSVIFEIKKPRVILDKLDGKTKAVLSQSITDVVVTSIIEREVIKESDSALFESLIDESLFFQRLDDAPTHILGTALVAAFEQLPFLTDEKLGERLKNLFTRTAEGRISHCDADEISALLLRRNFPKSAEVIFDTAEKYFRNDVKPIAMTIAENYQDTRKSTTAPNVKSKKLIPVLIATALKLERDAVVAHLGNLNYNPKQKFDVGVWPKDDPHFEVSVIITGQGNLSTQRLVADISKHIKPEFAFFVGVSGALKDGFFVGDVAYSIKVYFIEGGREDSEGVKSRPDQELVDEKLVQLTHRVAGAFHRDDGQGALGGFDVKDAVIASGAKVLTSKSKKAANFQHARNHFNDSSIIELEGFGFMVASRTNDVKFAMVIRGVSDGCEGKDPEKDKSDQPLAAENAASFLFALLKQCPILLSNKKQKRFFGTLLQSVTDFFGG